MHLNVTSAVLAGLALGSAAFAQNAIKYRGPITITRGGTYSGNWQSLSPQVPAVTIATSEPVIIENANIQSRGALIYSAFRQADLTVRNTRGVALHPGKPLRSYAYPGRFVALEEFRNVVIENNELIGTSGMYFRDFRGKASLGQTIKIRRNRARNIDGRYSTGPNTFSTSQHRLVQFVQLNGIRNIANVEIAWNEVVNEPGKSRVEENINMYVSSGTAKSPISIHDNYIQGAYGSVPSAAGYTGGGMNLADGGAKRLADAAGHIRAFNNQVVSTSNVGIAVSAGHDIDVYNNRIISSGYLPSGVPIKSQNVGVYVWDVPGDKKNKTFFNNTMRNNVIGWGTPLRGRGTQNPFWFPDCATDKRGASRCTGNVTLRGPITMAMEAQEYRRWQDKLRAAGVRVGPLKPPTGVAGR